MTKEHTAENAANARRQVNDAPLRRLRLRIDIDNNKGQ